MIDRDETQEWLRYFRKRPVQAVLAGLSSVLLFVTLIIFLYDLVEITESHVSLDDPAAILKYTTNCILVILLNFLVFAVLGALYAHERGVFGQYIAMLLISVGLVLIVVALVMKNADSKLLVSYLGCIACSAGAGFFAGVKLEKWRAPSALPSRPEVVVADEEEEEEEEDAGSAGAYREIKGPFR